MDFIRKNANVPNTLTLLRALVLPFGLLVVCHQRYGLALVLFVCMALTDLLDGYLARKLGQVTAFGKVFDSLMDKMLTISFLFVILINPGPIEFRLIPLQELLFIIYILLEAGLATSRLDRLKKPLGFMNEDGATKISKRKMWLLCITVGFMLLGLAIPATWPLLIGEGLFYLTVLLTGFSFAMRFKRVSGAFRSYRSSCKNPIAVLVLNQVC